MFCHLLLPLKIRDEHLYDESSIDHVIVTGEAFQLFHRGVKPATELRVLVLELQDVRLTTYERDMQIHTVNNAYHITSCRTSSNT